MTERKYQRGDKVQVLAHKADIGGISVLREAFYGTFIREYESKGEHYIELFGEGSHTGLRIIPKKHVVPVEEDEEQIEFDGEFYILTCKCGKLRKIKPQNVGQVKRCVSCQNEYNRKAAKDRYRRRK